MLSRFAELVDNSEFLQPIESIADRLNGLDRQDDATRLKIALTRIDVPPGLPHSVEFCNTVGP